VENALLAYIEEFRVRFAFSWTEIFVLGGLDGTDANSTPIKCKIIGLYAYM